MHSSRLLEVGALKPDNYACCSSWIDVLPIDLRASQAGITEQDFLEMDRETNSGVWDAISLSLVLNFVPEPRDRGELLSNVVCYGYGWEILSFSLFVRVLSDDPLFLLRMDAMID